MSSAKFDQKIVRGYFNTSSLAGKRKACDHRKQTLDRVQGGIAGMNSDIRLAVGFLDHPKTIKLRRKLGWEGFESLLRLWCWSAQYRPDGVFNDMTEEDIEIAAQWNNENNDSLTIRSTFVTTLVELRWLDVDNGVYSLHKWVDRNGYAASANDRSDKSRFSRMAKTHPSIYTELKGKGVDSISSNDYRKVTNRSTVVNESFNESLTNRSSPLPSPLPSPSLSNNPPIVPPSGDAEKIPFKEIIGHLSEKTGKRFSHTSKASQRCIRGRWDEGYRVEDFVAVIDNMTAAWRGDKEMDQYLRPSTLFGASKFEGYLNKGIKKAQNSDGLVY